MHIPDNYLSPQTCAVMFLAAAPVVVYSVKKVKVRLKEKKELAPMLGVAASLSFLMMMFNVPIPGGTTGHAVGGTLLAILIGPDAACIAVATALFLQAFLFGDGGILSLGANIFNMACVMPYVGYFIYSFFRKKGRDGIGAIIGSYLGINTAALFVGIELGLQPLLFHTANGQPLYNPYPLSVTIPAMCLAHLLVVGWIEVFFTFVIYKFVQRVAPGELYGESSGEFKRIKIFYGIILGLIVLSPLGLLAKGTAFGEWSNQELLARLKAEHLASALPHGLSHGLFYQSFLSDYQVPATSSEILGYVLSALIAVLVFLLLSKVLISYAKEKK